MKTTTITGLRTAAVVAIAVSNLLLGCGMHVTGIPKHVDVQHNVIVEIDEAVVQEFFEAKCQGDLECVANEVNDFYSLVGRLTTGGQP